MSQLRAEPVFPEAAAASSTPVPASTGAVRGAEPVNSEATAPQFRSNSAADRFMRRILRITAPQKGSIMGAHRAFRWSIVVSGIRCLITYLLVPILIPIFSLASWVATPVSLALCAFAAVNGVISVRRFWLADHRQRWMYTAFMALVFLVLLVAMIGDIVRLSTAG